MQHLKEVRIRIFNRQSICKQIRISIELLRLKSCGFIYDSSTTYSWLTTQILFF